MFVFIVGRGRSGTTLLKSMLDRHPDIAIAPESLFVISVYSRYRAGKWDKRRVLRFFNDIWLEGRLQNWGFDKELLKKRLLDNAGTANFSDLCRIVYQEYASQNGKKNVAIVGDKNPHYALFLHKLLKIFPDAHFIHLLRDYRDNVLSYKGVTFDLKNTAALSYRWVLYNKNVKKFASEYPDRSLQVKYEDLVLSSLVTLEKICAFIGVEYKSQMLESNDTSVKINQPWHKNVSRPPDPGLLSQWESRMSVKDLIIAESIAGKYGQEFGYERSQVIGKTYASNLLWCAFSWLYTAMEKLMFLMPLSISSAVLKIYRSKTRPNLN